MRRKLNFVYRYLKKRFRSDSGGAVGIWIIEYNAIVAIVSMLIGILIYTLLNNKVLYYCMCIVSITNILYSVDGTVLFGLDCEEED